MPLPIGSMYAIYDDIYHQYTPHVSIYTIHGSYGLYKWHYSCKKTIMCGKRLCIPHGPSPKTLRSFFVFPFFFRLRISRQPQIYQINEVIYVYVYLYICVSVCVYISCIYIYIYTCVCYDKSMSILVKTWCIEMLFKCISKHCKYR